MFKQKQYENAFLAIGKKNEYISPYDAYIAYAADSEHMF